jgi:hypothetical protein
MPIKIPKPPQIVKKSKRHPLKGTGFPPGAQVVAANGTVYVVQSDGSWRKESQ